MRIHDLERFRVLFSFLGDKSLKSDLQFYKFMCFILVPSLLTHANQIVGTGGKSFCYHGAKGCSNACGRSKVEVSGSSFARLFI